MRCGNVVALKEMLRESFARFELRRCLRRSEDAQSTRCEEIDDTCGKRRFGSDDSEIYLLNLGKGNQRVEVFAVPGMAPHSLAIGALGADAAVSRRAVKFFHARRLQ